MSSFSYDKSLLEEYKNAVVIAGVKAQKELEEQKEQSAPTQLEGSAMRPLTTPERLVKVAFLARKEGVHKHVDFLRMVLDRSLRDGYLFPVFEGFIVPNDLAGAMVEVLSDKGVQDCGDDELLDWVINDIDEGRITYVDWLKDCVAYARARFNQAKIRRIILDRMKDKV